MFREFLSMKHFKIVAIDHAQVMAAEFSLALQSSDDTIGRE
jgi:hypothetical protein